MSAAAFLYPTKAAYQKVSSHNMLKAHIFKQMMTEKVFMVAPPSELSPGDIIVEGVSFKKVITVERSISNINGGWLIEAISADGDLMHGFLNDKRTVMIFDQYQKDREEFEGMDFSFGLKDSSVGEKSKAELAGWISL